MKTSVLLGTRPLEPETTAFRRMASPRRERAERPPSRSVAVLGLGVAALLWAAPAPATLSDYQTAVTNEASIISYYSFDQGTAEDARGLHPGTLASGPSFVEGVGSAGQALSLDSAGRVRLGAVSDFDFGSGVGTVEFWVRVGWTAALTYNPCLLADRDGGAVRWSLHMERDRQRLGMWNGSSYLTVGIPDPGTNNWHHVVVVFDNSFGFDSVTYYWDGVLAGSVSQSLGTAMATTQFGSSSDGLTAEALPGYLDEIAFYSSALPETTVQEHYAALFAGTPPVIAQQPHGGTYLPGVALQLRVVATGPLLSYQWQKNGSPIAGATDSILNFDSLNPTDAGTYQVVVSNPAADVPSETITLGVAAGLPAEVTQYQVAVSNEASLISYYTFDRLTASDSKGFHDGILAGVTDFISGIGAGPDAALLLDGAGHVQLGAVSDFDFYDDSTGTVEAWVRADWTSIAGAPTVFADRSDPYVRYSVHITANKQNVGIWNGSAFMTVPIPDARTNWHHLAIVFEGVTTTVYWDGVARGTLNQEMGISQATTQLGARQEALGGPEPWLGALDEVAFYADALPAAAILAHYSAFAAGNPPEITVLPTGGEFLVGNGFQTTVGAIGANLEYQWYKDGVAIPGATDAFIGSGSLTAEDSGSYYVRVSNSAGTTNTPPVTLQVGNNITRYQGAVLAESSLIAYYTFDTGTAADAKGAHDGTVANLVSYIDGAGGVTNQALLLDGSGHIDLGKVPELEFPNGIGTAETWLRSDWTTMDYDPCVFANREGGPVDWSIHMDRSRGSIGNWNGWFYQALGMSNPGGWHHFAITFGGEKVRMYWDGQPLGETSQVINQGTGLSTQIGSSTPGATSEGWVGGLDEVAFYSSTLSAEAIRSHFLAMVGAAPEAPTLSYTQSGNQLTLSWPVDITGFTLESAPSLPATTWTAVPGVVNNSVTVTISTGMQFYRLKK